jgi:hypothetical protein
VSRTTPVDILVTPMAGVAR